MAKQRSKRELLLEKRLSEFLNKAEPKLVSLLATMWASQSTALTYAELEGAMQTNAVTSEVDPSDYYLFEDTFKQWQKDYAIFVQEQVYPLWIAAGIASVAAQREAGLPIYFDPMSENTKKWIKEKGGELIASLADEQQQAIKIMIEMAAEGNMTVDELGRKIRANIGLNAPQVKSNHLFYERKVQEYLKNGLSESAAKKKAETEAKKFAAKQHRYRGQVISRTELVGAYNAGATEAVKEAEASGDLGPMEKVWYTARDEMVCDICGPMHNKRVGINDKFMLPNGLQLDGPTAHPSCRCSLLYEEVVPGKTKKRKYSLLKKVNGNYFNELIKVDRKGKANGQ